MPYRDFRVEYPPGALPAFLLPAYDLGLDRLTDGAHLGPRRDVSKRRYAGSFVVLMAGLAMLIIAATSFSLAALRASLGHSLLACGVLAASPLVLGTLLYEHFDLWPAAVSAIAVAALLRDRTRLAAVILGLAVSVKIYPALLLPPLIAFAWKRVGRREALVALSLACASALVVTLPFAVVTPGGTAWSVRAQFQRGVQIESVASSAVVGLSHLVLKAHELGVSMPRPSFRLGLSTTPGISAVEIDGRAVDVASGLTTALAVALLLVLWVQFSRSRASKEDLVRCSAATLATAILLGRVLSPQYLVWLLPLVQLVGGRRGLEATALLEAALAVTHWWWHEPYRIFSANPTSGTTLILVSRNALLAALLLVLVWPRRTREPTPPRI